MAIKTVSGHGMDLRLDSYPEAPQGGTNKSSMNTNKKMKQVANYGNSGMTGYAASAAGVEAEGTATKSSSIGGANGSRNMGGNGRGKFPNMIKDMK